MLDFLKKKEAATAPVEAPTSGMVFETGKEIQFKDPKSGEFVYQRAVSPEHRALLMGVMQKNSGLANQFMSVCRQRVAIEEQIRKAHEEIIASEKEINDIINQVRDELKLDRRWGLNIQLGVLERRDPPSG